MVMHEGKPQIINGWTISFGNGKWKAVSGGVIGKQHEVRSYVETFARTTKPTK